MFDWLPPEWIAAITSSTATAVLGVALGTYYKAKVEKNIQHNFDAKLEALRSAMRREEDAFRADLRAKEEQIAALRSGALSGLANRHAAIDKRRLEAIDKLWASAVKQAHFKVVARMTSTMKMDALIAVAARKDTDAAKWREVAAVLWNACNLDELLQLTNQRQAASAEAERPFLPPMVWALFSAYRQVLARPVAQLGAVRTGAGPELLIDPKPMLDLVKSALPHLERFIDQNGLNQLPYLIDELEEALLRELQSSLHNTDADNASVDQAAAILRKSEKVAESMQVKQTVPDLRI